jgi:hypothetical protein
MYVHVICFIAYNRNRWAQRDGMGLLEHQAMHFGVTQLMTDGCVHFVKDQPQARASAKWCGPSGQAAWTVHHVKTIPYWVTLLQSARRATVLGQLSSLRPHWLGL